MTVDGLLVDESVVEDGRPFLSVSEVASRMLVSKMTVYRLVHSGDLPADRFGSTFRVERTAVEELIEAARYRAG
jgi:excisionase family DNA binding protein